MSVLSTSDLKQGTTVQEIVQETANESAAALASIPQAPPENPAGPLWNVNMGAGTVATHAPGAAFPAGTSKTRQRASLGWGLNHTAAEQDDQTKAQVGMGSPVSLQELRQYEQFDAVKRLLKKCQVAMFQGAGGANEIAGFGGAAGSMAVANTYANLSQVTYAEWQATVSSTNGTPGTSAALTKPILRNFLAEVEEKGDRSQDELVFWGNSKVYNAIIALYEGQVRYDSQRMLGGVRPLIVFDDVRMIRCVDAVHGDDDETKGTLFCGPVNWDSPKKGIHWQTLPYRKDDRRVTHDNLGYGVQLVESFQDGHSTKDTARNMMQLVNPYPAASGVLQDIAI